MAEQKISEIMETTMEKIKTMVDANTIIGDKIVVDDVTIIPISKLSFGFASGATDFAGKNNGSQVFAGGGGAGASINPVGFLVVKNGDVSMLPISHIETATSKVIDMLPETFQKIKGLFKKKDTETNVNTAE
ncbi:MAG: GerW family sporulation protein [Clostridia bacterium]|nr:GerW family sporulation protein [Clostridia bacterium]